MRINNNGSRRESKIKIFNSSHELFSKPPNIIVLKILYLLNESSLT